MDWQTLIASIVVSAAVSFVVNYLFYKYINR